MLPHPFRESAAGLVPENVDLPSSVCDAPFRGTGMDDRNTCADLLRRVRAHDECAAKRLVSVFSPLVIRFIGNHLRRVGLSAAIDPADVAQVVFSEFFSTAIGNLELTGGEDDVAKLLVTMARRQITDECRRAHALRRNRPRCYLEFSHAANTGAAAQDPSHDLIEKEQIQSPPPATIFLAIAF
jgi:hypothetical protein